MNQLYEIIKPVRKIEDYDGDNWFERWANFSPRGIVGFISVSYLSLLGVMIGVCLATTPLY